MSDQAKIGALVAIALVIGAYFLFKIENATLGRRSGSTFVVELDNAQGLTVKSLVLLKGIRIGRVSEMNLEGEKVHATVILQKNVMLREGTHAQVVSVGLLGEKQIELTPGPVDAPNLPPGSIVPGALSLSLDDVIETLGNIGDDLSAVTTSLRGAIGGEEGAKRLASLVAKTENTAEQLQAAVAENRTGLAETVQNLREVSRSLRRLTEPSEGVGGSGAADGPGGPPVSALERLEAASSHLQSVAQKLDSSEGTLGRLIKDPSTGEQIDQTLASVQKSVEGASFAVDWVKRTRLGFGARGDYLTAADAPRAVLQLDVRPPSNVFLQFEAIARGNPRSNEQVDDVSASALLGWRQRFFAIRAGVIESRLGAGADVFLFRDRIRLSADAWDPTRSRLRPHTRFEGALQIVPFLSLLAGWDDLLNTPWEADSFFLGAALRFDTGVED